MPVTVKELIVRATVVDTGNDAKTDSGGSSKMKETERDSIISDCVEEVLQLLKNYKER